MKTAKIAILAGLVGLVCGFLLGIQYHIYDMRRVHQHQVTVYIPDTGGYSIKTPTGNEMEIPKVGGMAMVLKDVETRSIMNPQ